MGQIRQAPGRDDAMHTRKRGGAWREGPLDGLMTVRGLGPAPVKSLACSVGMWLAVKSKRQTHLWYQRCRIEQVTPFLGVRGPWAGRKRALTRGSAEQEHLPLPLRGWLFRAQAQLPSCSCHVGNIWGTTFCQKTLPCPSCLTCLQQLNRVDSHDGLRPSTK